MDNPVDFTIFRSITEGDVVIESELFSMFLISSSECIAKMRAAQTLDDRVMWGQQAHALKSICFNLGAGPLGDLCKNAQNHDGATPDEKKAMLTKIEMEMERVKQAIKEQK